MEEIEAIVFDMDGVMFDTEKLWVNSVIKTNEEYGFNMSIDVVLDCIGKRNDFIDKQFKEVMGKDFDTNKFRELNIKYMEKEIETNGMPIKKGLIELLEYSKSKNIKLAIDSSSTFDKIKKNLEKANISIKIFDYVIGGNMVTKPKPDPQIYSISCGFLKADPKKTLALEDSNYGIISATGAGMKAILINDLQIPTDETLKISYKVLDSLYDVISLLENINNQECGQV